VDYSEDSLSKDLIFTKPQVDPILVLYLEIINSHEGTTSSGGLPKSLKSVPVKSHSIDDIRRDLGLYSRRGVEYTMDVSNCGSCGEDEGTLYGPKCNPTNHLLKFRLSS
jgi:hypothetical protein